MKFFETLSNNLSAGYLKAKDGLNAFYIRVRNYSSPGPENFDAAYPSFDTTNATEQGIAQKAKTAYAELLDPDTKEIDPSKVEKQLQATRYLLDYLNWVLINSLDLEKKKRAAVLKARLAEIYNRKKWINRFGELFSWPYGLMQGAAVAGYFILLFGIEAATSALGTGSGAIMVGAAIFLVIAGIRNYFLIKKDNPRLLLWAYNRWYQPKDINQNQQTKQQLAISAVMAIVGAAVWFGLVFFGSYEFLLAVERMITDDGGKSLGSLVWALPLGLSAFTIFLPELVLNFEGNKDFITDYSANRKNGKGPIESLGAPDTFWKDLETTYGLDSTQLEKIKHDFIKNAICVCIGMFGITLIGLSALKALYGGGELGLALSAMTLIIGTICQIPFYRARAKDQAKDDAKQILAAKELADSSNTSTAENKKPNSGSTNGQRYINAAGAAIPAVLGMYGAGGVDFISGVSSIGMGFAAFGVIVLMMAFGYLAYRNSMTATAAGSPDMLPIRVMAEEIEKPVVEGEANLVEQAKAEPQLYTICWGNQKTRMTPNLGCNYVDKEDFGDDLDAVEGQATTATRMTSVM